MSFRSGAAVGGGALAVAGVGVALAVALSGHSAAATSGHAPGMAAQLATPASSPRPRDLRRLLGHAQDQPVGGAPGGDRELLADPVPAPRVGDPAGLAAQARSVLGPHPPVAAPAAQVDTRRPAPPQPSRLGLARLVTAVPGARTYRTRTYRARRPPSSNRAATTLAAATIIAIT